MRKALGVSLLVLLLTGSASAGVIPNDTPAPPPPPASAVQEPADDATPGQIETPGVMGNDSPDSLTQTALDLLALLPSLF